MKRIILILCMLALFTGCHDFTEEITVKEVRIVTETELEVDYISMFNEEVLTINMLRSDFSGESKWNDGVSSAWLLVDVPHTSFRDYNKYEIRIEE